MEFFLEIVAIVRAGARLLGTNVGSDVDFANGHFVNPGRVALVLDNADIGKLIVERKILGKGNCSFTASQDRGKSQQ